MSDQGDDAPLAYNQFESVANFAYHHRMAYQKVNRISEGAAAAVNRMEKVH